MLAYRPPEKPFLQKASENLTVQLVVIFLLGAGAIYFIKQDHKETFWSRMRFLRGSGPQVSRSTDQNRFEAPAVTGQGSLEPLEQVAGDTSTAEENLASRNAGERTNPSGRPETKITFLEIPTSLLNRWFEEGVLTRVETSDGITIAYIPQLEKVLEISRAQVKVLKETRFPYTLNQLHTAKLENYPPKPTDPETAAPARVLANEAPSVPAINAYATLDEERRDTVIGQLEVTTNPQTSIPAHFEMTPDQTFFMSGFARPRNGERRSDTELVVILQILK